MRLVSLCPSITETLVAFGLRDALVGVTRYCVSPREAVAGLPRVGGTKDPDLAAIEALGPDLVLANEEESRAADLAALSRVHRVDVTHPRSPSEVPALLRHLGAVAGAPEAGELWAGRVEERLAALAPPRPFSFACLVWKGPFMAAAAGTYLSGLLELPGGANVFDDAGRPYPVVTEDEVVARRPGLLVLPDEPYRFREADRAFWEGLLPGARVVLAPGEDLCWHGVRTLRGLDVAAALAAGPGPPS